MIILRNGLYNYLLKTIFFSNETVSQHFSSIFWLFNEVCIDPNLEFFAQGANHPVVDFLLMCALKNLHLWIICVQRKNPLSTGLVFVRLLVIWIRWFLRIDVFCVRTHIFLIMILAFQRWIIFAHKQVPWHMDVFCVRTQIFLKWFWPSNAGLFAHMSKYKCT